MASRRIVPAVAGIALLSAVVTTGAAMAAPSASVSTAVSLPSVIPGWAKTSTVLGSTPADQLVYVYLTLKGQDPVGEKAYGVAASTPGNPLYRSWLTKDQFQARFGPAAGSAEAVTQGLAGLGITNVMTDKMGASVLALVPASVVTSVFKVQFEQVQHNGASTRVAMNQPTVPASIAPYVSVVSGLTDEKYKLDSMTVAPAEGPTPPTLPTGGAPTAYYNATPASSYYASNLATDKPTSPILTGDTSTTKPYSTKGYTPAQIRGAYDVDKVKYTGKGVTAGVVCFYDGPDVAADLAQFSTEQNLAVPVYNDLGVATEAITIAGGNAPVVAPADAEGEQTLDVESIHQMAPDATIYYSGAAAPENGPIDVAELTLVAAGINVINNSFGGTGETDAADQMAFSMITDMAKTMGVGIDFSTGDAADNVTAQGLREGDSPATSDGVTAVGGTGIEIGKNNNYIGEYYWGTYSSPALAAGDTAWKPFASQAGGAGGGGGLSTSFAEPTWQMGIVPAEETVNADTEASYVTNNGSEPTYGIAGAPGRVVPDVAMIADSTTGILVGETQQPDTDSTGAAPDTTPVFSYYRIGGTSVSSPIFTGMMALVDEAIGKSAGFVNPTMYPFLAKNNGAFRDPQIGRSATGSRSASTMAQVLTGCTGTAGTDQVCVSSGPGSIPVIAQVRSDYTDTANDGYATGVDATGTGLGPITSTTPGNPVISHLRANGVLGTLEDLPGYDDSTGLGSPDAPGFIADFLGTVPAAPVVTTTTAAAAPTTTAPTTTAPVVEAAPTSGSLAHTGSNPGLGLAAAALVAAGGGTLVVRRRSRRA